MLATASMFIAYTGANPSTAFAQVGARWVAHRGSVLTTRDWTGLVDELSLHLGVRAGAGRRATLHQSPAAIVDLPAAGAGRDPRLVPPGPLPGAAGDAADHRRSLIRRRGGARKRSPGPSGRPRIARRGKCPLVGLIQSQL